MQEKGPEGSSEQAFSHEKLDSTSQSTAIPMFKPTPPADDRGVGIGEGLGATKRTSSQMSDARDFESVTMMKMRQAEERKKLIEQMMKEDEDS